MWRWYILALFLYLEPITTANPNHPLLHLPIKNPRLRSNLLMGVCRLHTEVRVDNNGLYRVRTRLGRIPKHPRTQSPSQEYINPESTMASRMQRVLLAKWQIWRTPAQPWVLWAAGWTDPSWSFHESDNNVTPQILYYSGIILYHHI